MSRSIENFRDTANSFKRNHPHHDNFRPIGAASSNATSVQKVFVDPPVFQVLTHRAHERTHSIKDMVAQSQMLQPLQSHRAKLESSNLFRGPQQPSNMREVPMYWVSPEKHKAKSQQPSPEPSPVKNLSDLKKPLFPAVINQNKYKEIKEQESKKDLISIGKGGTIYVTYETTAHDNHDRSRHYIDPQVNESVNYPPPALNQILEEKGVDKEEPPRYSSPFKFSTLEISSKLLNDPIALKWRIKKHQRLASMEIKSILNQVKDEKWLATSARAKKNSLACPQIVGKYRALSKVEKNNTIRMFNTLFE